MTDATVSFESVSKMYRRGTERANLRAALPGRLGRPRHDDRRGFWALHDVSLEATPGEILGIIGPNGSGKSTTLKLAARVIAPTTGRVTTRGRLVSLIELGVGFHADLTGAENVRFAAAVLGMSQRDLDRRYDEIVDFAGIEAFMGTPVKRYSSGMLARLGFAVASHLDAEIVLIDEVMAVGDVQYQRRGYERMRALRDQGATLFFVTHNLLLMPEVCQRAIRLQAGRVVDHGDPRSVVDRYIATVGKRDDVSAVSTDQLELRIRGIELSVPAIRPGDGLEVAAIVEVAEPLPDVRLTLVFTNENDSQVAGMDIPASADALARPGTWRFEGMLPTVALVPGTYRVTFSVIQQVSDMPLTIDQAATQLAIISAEESVRQYGETHVPSTWLVRPANGPPSSY